MIIAIDGPAASGKGTIARAVAAHFGLPHLDTGLLYRAVGYTVMKDGGDPADPADALMACQFDDALLSDPGLARENIGAAASKVSAHPEVREALFKRQRAFAEQPGGAVLDGRDISTVIAPDADVKLFVIASAEVRAERRYEQMRAGGAPVTYDAILSDIRARDERDSNRATAPLIQAEDAILLNTGNLTIGEAVQAAISAVEARLRPE